MLQCDLRHICMITDKATASNGVSGGLTGGSTDGISEINSENPLDLSDDQEYEGLTFDQAYEYCSSLGLGFKMMY